MRQNIKSITDYNYPNISIKIDKSILLCFDTLFGYTNDIMKNYSINKKIFTYL
jgi:hypothetical protein